jgi:hypothetical protein
MENFTTRFWSQVDKTGTCWNWTGCTTRDGYGKIRYGGRAAGVHRVSYEMSGEVIPEGMDVDHICRNRVCVRPDHLRLATRKENNENHGGAYKNSQSGVRGVTRQKNRWRAQVRHNGKLISVGSYVNIEDAEAAVIAKRLELFTRNEQDRAA